MKKKYLMQPILENFNSRALFFNKIDYKVRDKEEEFLIYREELNKKYNQDDTVRYYFNSLGFRSDEFTKNHNGKHILFAGCSETEGYGGNLESSWPYMVYSELCKKEKISGFFNLSRGGWGHEIIISNIMAYINDYGKPDKIYILLPNMGRIYQWEDNDDDKENYFYKYFLPDKQKITEPKDKKLTVEEQRNIFITFTILMKIFEDYCISNNIELFWSTWDYSDAINYTNVNIFKKFIKFIGQKDFIIKNQNFFIDQIKTNKNWNAKRDGHHGYFYHYLWAQHFLGKIDTKDY
jgi:hypothetical protein